MDIFGNLKAKQDQIAQQLSSLVIERSSPDGEITVEVSGLREVKDIRVDFSKIDTEDADQLQDLLVTTINAAMDEAKLQEAQISQSSMKDILPPGFENLMG